MAACSRLHTSIDHMQQIGFLWCAANMHHYSHKKADEKCPTKIVKVLQAVIMTLLHVYCKDSWQENHKNQSELI